MYPWIRAQRNNIKAGVAVVIAAGVVAAGPSLRPAPDRAGQSASQEATPLPAPGPQEATAAPEAEDAADIGPVVLATEEGRASYYASSLAGRRTASGVPYRPRAMVAAHRTLPFGTWLRVENLANGRVVEVEVVDRGPFTRGRILDLSRRAAEELGFVRQGHTRVRIEVLEYGDR
jgi:rare lipoprotein A